MQTFTVYLNKKKLCVAGFEGEGVLVVNLNAVNIGKRKEFALNVGALNSSTDEHLRWHEGRRLKVGDEIKVLISKTPKADQPMRRFFSSSNPTVQNARGKKSKPKRR